MELLKLLKSCLVKSAGASIRLRTNPKTYKCGGDWGNRIEWISWEKRSVVGWKEPRPKVGDLLECNMKGGKTAILRFVKVDYCNDPYDMFFGLLRDVEYKDRGKTT